MSQGKQFKLELGVPNDIPHLLISIREKYHLAIVEGRKKYEYRRVFPRIRVNAFIYVPGKIPGISAYAEFGEPIVGPIDVIAEIYEKEDSGNKSDLYAYFDRVSEGFAVPIERYVRIPTVSLQVLRQEFRGFFPPQSYSYLDKKPDLLKFLNASRDTRS